jgi:hypothetical protein
MIIKTLLHLVLLTVIINAQQFTIKGKIVDADLKSPLSFANIRVAETALGTSSNVNGEFELKLKQGTYKLIASFIGYYSDTVNVEVDKNLSKFFITAIRNSALRSSCKTGCKSCSGNY